MARTLATYIARIFTLWCSGVFLTILGLIFISDFLELVRRGATKPDATMSLMLEMAALKLPHMAQEVLPFAILFGTMLAFWRLTKSHELVIARASGVSVWQFLGPALLLTLAIGVVAVTIFNPVASAMEASFQALENRVLKGNSAFSVSDGGIWLRQSDEGGNQIVIHADRMAPTEVELTGATFLFYKEGDRLTARIDCAGALLLQDHWHLMQVVLWMPDQPSRPIPDLDVPTNLTPRKIQESFATPETLSFWDLPGFIRLLESAGFSAQRHRLYFYSLLAQPFLLCAMVLVAAIFSLRPQRRGGTTLLVASGVVTGLLLYFMSNIVFALGQSGTIPIVLAALTPAGVSTLFGTSMLLHLEDG